jgi:hypothetical protein
VINQSVKTLCFLFTIILMGGVSVYGQENVGRSQQGLSAGNGKCIITNGDDTTRVNFYLKNGDGGWARFGLDPSEDAEFSNATNIKIISEDNKVVQYRLVGGKRYRIFWREAEKYWDIVMLK